MKKLLILAVCSSLAFTSCVSKKKYAELEAKQKNTQDLLNTATVKLNDCLAERAAASARAQELEGRLADLRKTNADLIESSKELTMLTSKGATNLEKSL